MKNIELDLVYIAAPYVHENKLVMQLRHEIINVLCGKIITEFECCIFSPINHSHFINVNLAIDKRTYWMITDLKILKNCSHMFVLMLDGWEESLGVAQELKFCEENNIEVLYIKPSQLIDMEEVESIETAIINSETRLDTLQFVIGDWGEKTFPKSTSESILLHLEDEVRELSGANDKLHTATALNLFEADPPSDKDPVRDLHHEVADVGLLLLHFCYKNNIDLGKVLVSKFRINQLRKCTEENDRGYFGHI